MSKNRSKLKTPKLTWHQARKLAARKKILLSLFEVWRKGSRLSIGALERKSRSKSMTIRHHLLAAGHLRRENGVSIVEIDRPLLDRQIKILRRGGNVLSDEDMAPRVRYQGSSWEAANQATLREAEKRILTSALELIRNNKQVNYRSIGAHCHASKSTVAAVMKRSGHSVRRGSRDMLKIDLTLLGQQVQAMNHTPRELLKRKAAS